MLELRRALDAGDRNRLARAWLLACVVAALIFSAMPWIDLRVSALFFDGRGFPLEKAAPLAWLRYRIWDASILLTAVALAGLVVGKATGRPGLWLPPRVWGFVLALYGIGVGVVTNLLLKDNWGRARPSQVTEFGGTKLFTAPLLPADQCAQNCSFVSGEGSAAAALGLSLAVIAWHLRHRIGPRRLWQVWALALVLALAGSLLRIVTGRHFLSDVVFSWLVVAGVGLALAPLLRPARDPLARVLTPPAIPPKSAATRTGGPSQERPKVALD